MKKLLYLTLLLSVTISFGQSKKKKTAKTTPNKTVETVESESERAKRFAEMEQSIVRTTLSPDNIDSYLVIEGTSSPIVANNGDEIIYNDLEVDVKPEFTGGIDKMNKFISNNFKVEDEEINIREIQASFVIEKDGGISNIRINKDYGYGSGKEAIRVIKKMPRWNPAQYNGKAVRSLHKITMHIDGN
jgi:protein TonB